MSFFLTSDGNVLLTPDGNIALDQSCCFCSQLACNADCTECCQTMLMNMINYPPGGGFNFIPCGWNQVKVPGEACHWIGNIVIPWYYEDGSGPIVCGGSTVQTEINVDWICQVGEIGPFYAVTLTVVNYPGSDISIFLNTTPCSYLTSITPETDCSAIDFCNFVMTGGATADPETNCPSSGAILQSTFPLPCAQPNQAALEWICGD